MRRLVALLLLLPWFGCGDSVGGPVCTQIGCTDGLTLRLLAPEGGFDDGTYQAAVTLDDEVSTCDWQVSGSPTGECETTVFTSNEIAITFAATPDDVALTVTRGGMQVVSETLMPTYDVVQPNGAGCEPTCRQAVVPVSLP